jgi:hypothetical protein
MDGNRFDNLVKTMSVDPPSRRRVVAGLIGAALVGVAGPRSIELAAAQEATARGCLNEGRSCTRGKQCCSGLCKGRKCRRAPGQGTCNGENTCRVGVLTRCSLDPNCFCLITTRGASFCGDFAAATCSPCAGNSDCAAITGPGSACIRFDGRNDPDCDCRKQGSNTACMPPCSG